MTEWVLSSLDAFHTCNLDGNVSLNNCQNDLGTAFQRVDKLDVVLKYLVKTKGQDDAAVRTDTFLMHPAA